ncbi:hypothetical protein BT69DRAFT_1286457 [Atractiella rhizophila]|nr:hypothetical protein BT69DRAFT_1286457 [Atractiella rhizophila]
MEQCSKFEYRISNIQKRVSSRDHLVKGRNCTLCPVHKLSSKSCCCGCREPRGFGAALCTTLLLLLSQHSSAYIQTGATDRRAPPSSGHLSHVFRIIPALFPSSLALVNQR